MKVKKYIFLFFSILTFIILIKKYPKYLDQDKFVKIFFLLILFFFLTISIFLKNNLQKKLNIFFIIFILSTYLLNLLVGIQFYLTSTTYKNVQKYKELEIKFDNRDPLTFIKETNNKDLLPFVTPSELMKKNLDITILSGIPNQEYIQCNEYGEWKKIYTDSLGYNNLTSSSYFDILLVGDSFAQGVCVDQKKETHNLLTKNGLKTYSAGFAGNGPLLTLATLIEINNVMNFKNIVWLFFRNDFYDLKWESNNNNLMKYLEEDFKGINYFNNLNESIIYQKNYINKNSSKKIGFNFQESFFQLKFLNDYINKIIKKDKKKETKNYSKLLVKIFKSFDIRFTEKNKILIYLPNQRCFTDHKEICDEEFFLLQKIVKNANIEIFDFREVFKGKNYKSFFGLGLDRTHYSNTGYENLSNYIQDIIK